MLGSPQRPACGAHNKPRWAQPTGVYYARQASLPLQMRRRRRTGANAPPSGLRRQLGRLLHHAGLFALPLALANGVALIVLLLTAGEGNLKLSP